MSVVESIGQYQGTSADVPREQYEKLRVPVVEDQPRPHRFFLMADLCLVWVSAGIAHLLLLATSRGAHEYWDQNFFGLSLLNFGFLFSVLVVLFAHARGLYEFPWKKSYPEDLKLLAYSVICSGIVASITSYLGGTKGSTGAVALTAILTWVSIAAWRKFVRSQSIPGVTEKWNVLIVGYGRVAHLLERHLEENPHLGFVVKGFVSARRFPRPGDNGNVDLAGRLFGTVDQLPAITRAHFIDEILISAPSDRHLVKDITQMAQAVGVQVRVVPDLYDGAAAEQPVEYIGEFPTLTLCHSAAPTLSFLMKRMIDILLSGIALVVLSPVFAVVAILIKLDSKGPVFYRSITAGKKGVTIVCYKFRTMVVNADRLKKSLEHLNERSGVFFKIDADPRITRVGRVLRKFSIDELPELWNVFKGDMSLVGPRPPACGEFSKYSLEHLCRLDVTPGLTGLWQVTARQDPSFENCIELDKEYVKNWSLGLDFKILLKTVGVVLAGTGR